MSIELLDRITLALIIATLPSVNTFWLVYVLTTRWWTTTAGRALMVKSFSTLLLIDLAAMVRWVKISPYTAAWLRVAIFATICVGVTLMCYALLREQVPRLLRWLRRDEASHA